MDLKKFIVIQFVHAYDIAEPELIFSLIINVENPKCPQFELFIVNKNDRSSNKGIHMVQKQILNHKQFMGYETLSIARQTDLMQFIVQYLHLVAYIHEEYKKAAAEIEATANDKRTKKSVISNVSQEYANDFEENNELSPRLSKLENKIFISNLPSFVFSYDEDSLEGKYYENKNSQDEPSSQPITDSKYFSINL